MDYGKIVLHIEQLLETRGISKNRICKDLDIPRSNFNRYCRNEFQRADSALLCKLCWYLDVNIAELLEYIPPQQAAESDESASPRQGPKRSAQI